MLNQLIRDRIDAEPMLRKQLVSAVLLGGNVLVPKGGTVGGDFQNVPACQSAGQTHCVVAYSSFLSEPPEGADFGRVSSPLLGATSEQLANDEVLCVNPTLANQGPGSGPLLRYEATTPIPGFPFPAPSAPTPWVSMPGQYSGQCDHANGASWLQLSDVGPGGDPREQVAEVLGPLWGTHLEDINIALGNLVDMTGLQAATYHAEKQAEASPPRESPSPPASPSPPVTPPPPTSSSPPTSSEAPASSEGPASPSQSTTRRPVASRTGCKPPVSHHHVARKSPPACKRHKQRTPKRKPTHKRKPPPH
jgi:hypothetical protein